MPVPNSMADLAQLASANFPTGTESIGNNLDNYLRAIQAIIRSTNAVASATIAAASTTDVGSADGQRVTVTGNATINGLGTGFPGCYREVNFTGTCTMVNSGSLILPGLVNLQITPGDVYSFRCTTSGVWQLVSAYRDPTAVRRAGDTMTGNLNAPYFVANGAIPAFQGSGNTVILGTGASGTVYTRPLGSGVTTVQTSYDSTGRLANAHTGNDYLVSARGSYTFSWFNFGNGQTGLFDNTAGANAMLYNTAGSGAWLLRGDVTASGNVTGGSDERVKENWRSLPNDLIEQLAALERVGTYDRTDIGTTQTGVGAQSLRKILPHTVQEGDDGFLSVAYGNAAFVGVVATARRLLALEARVAELGGG